MSAGNAGGSSKRQKTLNMSGWNPTGPAHVNLHGEEQQWVAENCSDPRDAKLELCKKPNGYYCYSDEDSLHVYCVSNGSLLSYTRVDVHTIQASVVKVQALRCLELALMLQNKSKCAEDIKSLLQKSWADKGSSDERSDQFRALDAKLQECGAYFRKKLASATLFPLNLELREMEGTRRLDRTLTISYKFPHVEFASKGLLLMQAGRGEHSRVPVVQLSTDGRNVQPMTIAAHLRLSTNQSLISHQGQLLKIGIPDSFTPGFPGSMMYSLVFEGKQSRWTTCQVTLSTPRFRPMCVIVGGMLLVAGGIGPKNTILTSMEFLDPVTKQFKPLDLQVPEWGVDAQLVSLGSRIFKLCFGKTGKVYSLQFGSDQDWKSEIAVLATGRDSRAVLTESTIVILGTHEDGKNVLAYDIKKKTVIDVPQITKMAKPLGIVAIRRDLIAVGYASEFGPCQMWILRPGSDKWEALGAHFRLQGSWDRAHFTTIPVAPLI